MAIKAAPPKVKKIIDDRGGYKAVAEGLSKPGDPFPPTTVHSWYRANRLPKWRIDDVLAIPPVDSGKGRAARGGQA